MNKHLKVKPKKHLGQHFLTDLVISQEIVSQIPNDYKGHVMEIGPGMGVLTSYLVKSFPNRLSVFEVDAESVKFLKNTSYVNELELIEGDFLQQPLDRWGEHLAIIGNFPYNISSQIFFKLLEYRDRIDLIVCMLQKEVADRLASPPGNKSYGILSVLLQVFFDIEKVLIVEPGAFYPPPKVRSAVITLKRNQRKELECDEILFKKVVKTAFNTRRKTLRNALKPLTPTTYESLNEFMDKRAEQLSCSDFMKLTNIIQSLKST